MKPNLMSVLMAWCVQHAIYPQHKPYGFLFETRDKHFVQQLEISINSEGRLWSYGYHEVALASDWGDIGEPSELLEYLEKLKP